VAPAAPPACAPARNEASSAARPSRMRAMHACRSYTRRRRACVSAPAGPRPPVRRKLSVRLPHPHAHKQTSRGKRGRVRTADAPFAALSPPWPRARRARPPHVAAWLASWLPPATRRGAARKSALRLVPIGAALPASSTRATPAPCGGAAPAAFRARRVHTHPCSTRAGAMRRV
jgi:hypothetical protein